MSFIGDIASVVVVAASAFLIGLGVGASKQAETMTDRCKSTGMYLTEGYAISCRVLTNEGYAPMIEQTKGK
jgi:hypothetical protein